MNDLMQFIDINPIVERAKKENCPFIAIIGGKGTGKTYGCVKWCLDNSDNFKKPAFYIRRYDKTFTNNICGNLFNVHRQDIINMSKGKYNFCELYGKTYTLMRKITDEKGNTKRYDKKLIAYCRSLNNVESETGDDKEEISGMIYDEFMSREGELKNEFQKLMIIHSNATRNRTDCFVPLFLLGNTVTKDSELAEHFGINLREIKRGLNIIKNKKGQTRLVLYYTPTTTKQHESAETYYDRFENDNINMISHGDWILGQYPIAYDYMLSWSGINFLMFNKGLAVKVTLVAKGFNVLAIIKKTRKGDAEQKGTLKISPIVSENNLLYIPDIIIECIMKNAYYVENSDIGEDFRDICKHIVNGAIIVNKIG